MDFLKTSYDTEGPLGLPMKDKQARLLDGILKTLPEEDRRLCRIVTAKKPSELLDGERADVSWISTEEIDRDREIVVARGMNDDQFKLNPIVTLQHCYGQPPVGRSCSTAAAAAASAASWPPTARLRSPLPTTPTPPMSPIRTVLPFLSCLSSASAKEPPSTTNAYSCNAVRDQSSPGRQMICDFSLFTFSVRVMSGER
jgi:hypothetical protein